MIPLNMMHALWRSRTSPSETSPQSNGHHPIRRCWTITLSLWHLTDRRHLQIEFMMLTRPNSQDPLTNDNPTSTSTGNFPSEHMLDIKALSINSGCAIEAVCRWGHSGSSELSNCRAQSIASRWRGSPSLRPNHLICDITQSYKPWHPHALLRQLGWQPRYCVIAI